MAPGLGLGGSPACKHEVDLDLGLLETDPWEQIS